MKTWEKNEWIKCIWNCEGLTLDNDYKVIDVITSTGSGDMVKIINDNGEVEEYFTLRFVTNLKRQRKEKIKNLNELHQSTF